MDPISVIGLAASISELATLSSDGLLKLSQHRNVIPEAPKGTLELFNEFASLSALLWRWGDLLKSSPEVPWRLPTSLRDSVIDTTVTLRMLNERLRLVSRQGARWPLSENENQGFLERLERHKGSLSLLLNESQTL